VAGVFDADAETLNVYLNGELDNGFLLGSVTAVRKSSQDNVYVGRRVDSEGFGFAGTVDDVRIYSLASREAEIDRILNGTELDDDVQTATTENNPEHGRRALPVQDRPECGWSSELGDARLPGAVACLGVLIAVACIGLWPSVGPMRCLVVCALAGWHLLHVASSTLPPLKFWAFPLTSIAGGMSVITSTRCRNELVEGNSEIAVIENAASRALRSSEPSFL
jgi:hypothetical protein